jgi:CTP synthase
MEILELQNHPFFVATQYHPEYKSRPLKPSPPFLGFVLASSGQLREYLNDKSSSAADVAPAFPKLTIKSG